MAEHSPDKRERFLRVVGELMPRINEAIGRITSGEAAMRIPVDKTDPDIVLGECSNALAYARDHLACAPSHVAPSGSVADLCANIVTDMLGNEKGEQIATRIRASFPSTTGRNAGLEEAALRCEQSASAFRSMKSAQDGTPDKDAELAEEMAYCCLLQARWIREMQSKTPVSATPRIPDELFDGFAVYNEMTWRERNFTTPENVSAVLDALARLLRRADGSTQS